MRHRRFIVYYLIASFIILVLAVAFHHPVRIMDVLSDTAAKGFEIKISPWRIVLEPFVGPIVFTLHANQPLVEFAVIFLWILAITLAVKLFQNRKKPLAGILQWLSSVPLIVMIWLGIGMAALFVPLPNETVISHDPDWILVNFHSHSHYSHDGVISHADLHKWHRSHGFDAFFLTEHNHHETTLELLRLQQQDKLPASPMILCGQEYSGSNHLLLLGLNENFISKDMPDTTAIQTAHDQNGAAIVAHWFRKRKNTRSIQHYIDCGVDGFEIANQNEGMYYDRQIFRDIVDACRANGLLMIGACDYHGYGNVCSVWNALNLPGWHHMDVQQKRQSIVSLLKERDQDRLSVMLYHDRPVGLHPAWGPLYNIFYYFRSLNLAQSAAWLVWIFLIYIICIHRRIKRAFASFNLPALAGLAGGLWVIFWGVDFYLHSVYLKGYNKIHHELALWFLIIGMAGSIYSRYRLFAKKKTIL